jgi:hypothetical protein
VLKPYSVIEVAVKLDCSKLGRVGGDGTGARH